MPTVTRQRVPFHRLRPRSAEPNRARRAYAAWAKPDAQYCSPVVYLTRETMLKRDGISRALSRGNLYIVPDTRVVARLKAGR